MFPQLKTQNNDCIIQVIHNQKTSGRCFIHIWMNICIPNAYSLLPALKLFIEKGDKVNFIYPGTFNHFKYRYDVQLHAVHEKIITVEMDESTINIEEDISVFSIDS